MTKVEAIKILKRLSNCKDECDYHCYLYDRREEWCEKDIALDLAIKALDQQPYESCIRELIREFDDKHPALFADYMQEFNNHPISEIIEYMWDMHNLIEDIKYRLPNKGGEEE